MTFELSEIAKDAFVVLTGARKIEYRDGDSWTPEEGQVEHPIVHRLRAASLKALTQDPPSEPVSDDAGFVAQLREERLANNALRNFLVDLETLCHERGMPKTVVGREVLTWIGQRIG